MTSGSTRAQAAAIHPPGFLLVSPSSLNSPDALASVRIFADAANEERIIAGVAGPLLRSGIGERSLSCGSESEKIIRAVFKPVRKPLSRSRAEPLLQIAQANACAFARAR